VIDDNNILCAGSLRGGKLQIQLDAIMTALAKGRTAIICAADRGCGNALLFMARELATKAGLNAELISLHTPADGEE
jgi:hypothetical protein